MASGSAAGACVLAWFHVRCMRVVCVCVGGGGAPACARSGVGFAEMSAVLRIVCLIARKGLCRWCGAESRDRLCLQPCVSMHVQVLRPWAGCTFRIDVCRLPLGRVLDAMPRVRACHGRVAVCVCVCRLLCY
jgi:hypothetical protein